MFVINESIIKTLTFNCRFWPKYKPSIHNITSSSGKSPSGLNQERNTNQNSSKQIYEDFDVKDNRLTFSLEEALLWIMDLYFCWKQGFEVKTKKNLDGFVLQTQLLAFQDINWWTGVVWITCDVTISCLDSHSDGTHSLQRIQCWASDVVLHFSKSAPMKKQNRGWSEWVNFQQILIFGWTVPLSLHLRAGNINRFKFS